jgi:DUF2934 family protein
MQSRTDTQEPSASMTQDNASRKYEEISVMAHELWLLRGSPEGSPEEDWFEAERRLKQSSYGESLREAA